MVRYQESAVPSGGGIREENLHQGTGLRNFTVDAMLGVRQDASLISRTAPTLTDVSTFTSIKTAAWRGHLPVPMTPTIYGTTVVAGATATIQFRVTGYDQFDNHIVEVTPVITVVTGSFNIILHMSKVFRFCDNLEYKATGLTAMVITFTVLNVIDPTGVEGAVPIDIALGGGLALFKMIGTWANWGIGTPLRVAPYSTALPASTQPNFAPTRLMHQVEITGAAAIRLRESNTPVILNNLPNSGSLPIFGDNAAGNTTIRLGQSAGAFSSGGFKTDTAWQGTPHKIGFVSSDGWATGFSKAFTGSSTRATGSPQALNPAQVGEDDLQFIFTLRSQLGSRRQTSPESSYPRG